MYVVGAYVSSSGAVIAEDPPVRCSVLGMFIHYFFLCQFSWMFIQVQWCDGEYDDDDDDGDDGDDDDDDDDDDGADE